MKRHCLGKRRSSFNPPLFEIASAYQGQEGLDLVEKSLWADQPYALAFVDVRMPPGWDGVETISKIWQGIRAASTASSGPCWLGKAPPGAEVVGTIYRG